MGYPCESISDDIGPYCNSDSDFQFRIENIMKD